MRNLIMGVIGVLWGAAILLYALLTGGPKGEGPAFAGAVTADILGALMFVAGIYYAIVGIQSLQEGAGRPSRKRKRPKRRRARVVEDEEDDE
jgi:hypothetical protein